MSKSNLAGYKRGNYHHMGCSPICKTDLLFPFINDFFLLIEKGEKVYDHLDQRLASIFFKSQVLNILS